MKISILGPAWPYRGGIAAFNERLAHQLQSEEHTVRLYTFTLQYPSFLFPGKTQYSVEPKPADLDVERCVNSCNPFSWISTGRKIKKEAPDLLIVAYWLPFMAPALGTVCRIAKSNGVTRVIALLHNLIPHEHRPGDTFFSRYFIGSIDGAVSLSKSVLDDVAHFNAKLPRVFSPHPLYDNFGEAVTREEACAKLGLDPNQRYFLFFGLIRDYKGLDWLLEAYAKTQELLKSNVGDNSTLHTPNFSLIIAGEFYSDGTKYHEQAQRLGIEDRLIWKSEFVPDSEVKYYFGAADLIVQPYKTATQSGVTQIAYHFEKPMLVTRVGGLAEIVPDGKVGYAVEPEITAIAEALTDFTKNHPDFTEGIRDEKRQYSWSFMTQRLLSLLPSITND